VSTEPTVPLASPFRLPWLVAHPRRLFQNGTDARDLFSLIAIGWAVDDGPAPAKRPGPPFPSACFSLSASSWSTLLRSLSFSSLSFFVRLAQARHMFVEVCLVQIARCRGGRCPLFFDACPPRGPEFKGDASNSGRGPELPLRQGLSLERLEFWTRARFVPMLTGGQQHPVRRVCSLWLSNWTARFLAVAFSLQGGFQGSVSTDWRCTVQDS